MTEKAFKHIYQILQVLDKYLVDNPKQHQHCMSPDSEYITLIAYAITLGIDLCNFLAIWAVLSILLDTMSSDLQYVQCLQQVYDNYYETHTQDARIKLEQQAMKIQDIMYDSMTKHNFDRVSGAVDRDLDKVNTNSIKLIMMKMMMKMIMIAILTQVVQNMIRTLRLHPKTLTLKIMYKTLDMTTK